MRGLSGEGAGMKVLVACEFSGIVRDAFIAKGHDAVSCDLLPSDKPGPHIQDDVLNHLNEGWDLMVGHPPVQIHLQRGKQLAKPKTGSQMAGEPGYRRGVLYDPC
jgi:hypothetical protein